TAVAYACVEPIPTDDSCTTAAGSNVFYGISSNNSLKIAGYSYGVGNLAVGQLGSSATNGIFTQYNPCEIFLFDAQYEFLNFPQPVPVKIYTTGDSIYVLASDGSLWSAGRNDEGQLGKGVTGDNTINHRLTRISFSGGGVVKKFATNYSGTVGRTTCLALVQNASGFTLYGWGRNTEGQLGTGTTALLNTPTPVNIQSGSDTYNTIKDIVVCGRQNYGMCAVLFESGRVRAAGYNGHGQLARGNQTASTVWDYVKIGATTNLSDVVEICGSNAFISGVYYRTSQGRIYYSGFNDGNGPAGNGTSVVTPYFLKTVSGGDIWKTGPGKFIYSSGGYTVGTTWAFAENGNLYRWGYNGQGQLANGTTTAQLSPILLSGYNLANIKKLMPFQQEDSNASGSVAILLNDGRIMAAGYNGYGNLGVGDASNRSSLSVVLFPRDKVKNIFWLNKMSSNYSLCVLGKDGNLYTTATDTWGMFLRGGNSSLTYLLTAARL
ncbi:MAG: hypothetical protein EBQ92_06105, partial [Proteobacteria bacterium]|nr:hypothetical protein [Pseudomonadota bacterium]